MLASLPYMSISAGVIVAENDKNIFIDKATVPDTSITQLNHRFKLRISGLPVRAPVFQSCLLWHIFSLEMIIALSSSASKPSLYFLQSIQLGDEICRYLLRTIFPG